MKLLRNPIVTGVLAVIAVVVVYLQVAPQGRFSLGGAGTPALALAPAAAPAPAPPAAPASAPAVSTVVAAEAYTAPSRAVDREFVELHFDGWVNWPQRDPFLILTPDPPDLKNKDVDANSPVGSWKLKAIWAQTASRPLAVINHGVYREGDEIQGYKIIKIEGDEVWFQGPRRKERLGFDRRIPPHP